jgi:hypothetical protein
MEARVNETDPSASKIRLDDLVDEAKLLPTMRLVLAEINLLLDSVFE